MSIAIKPALYEFITNTEELRQETYDVISRFIFHTLRHCGLSPSVADDMLGHIWLRISGNIFGLSHATSPVGYLVRIIQNAARDLSRTEMCPKHSHTSVPIPRSLTSNWDSEPGTEAEVVEDDIYRCEVLATMTARDAHIASATYEGYTSVEIANQLDIHPNTVYKLRTKLIKTATKWETVT